MTSDTPHVSEIGVIVPSLHSGVKCYIGSATHMWLWASFIHTHTYKYKNTTNFVDCAERKKNLGTTGSFQYPSQLSEGIKYTSKSEEH